MKNILSLFALLFYAHLSIAQCSVVINTPTTSVECGDCFTLTAEGSAQSVLLNEDFNNSQLGPGWTSSQTLMYTNPCGAPPDGTPAAWFGNQQSHPRELTTIDYDMTCGGDICFMMKYATQGGPGSCEGPDLPNEGVSLQYSINSGNSWITIFDHVVLAGGYDSYQTTWNQYCYSIPLAAQTVATRFRWIQLSASGAGNDHWGIDDIQVSETLCGSYYYDWSADGITNGPDTTLCQDTSSEDYFVIFTNGIDDTCSAVITMNSAINIDLGPDSVLNCGQTMMDIVGTESGSSGGYDYEWSPNVPDINSNTQNGVTPGIYWLEITDQNYANCVSRDSILIDVPTDPVAEFNFNSVCAGYDLTFTDNVTLGDGPIISNEWDFDGDGIVDTAGTSILTNYPYGGTYQVTYFVEDNKGCTNSLTKAVEIHAGPDVDFVYDPACSGYPTQFTNLTTPPPGSTNDTWLWTFLGQSLAKVDENPSHEFTATGAYNVRLQATSSDGCSADTTIEVVIKQSPGADFDYYAPCEGEEITFTNTSTGNYGNSQWIFSNGADTIKAQDAAYTFAPGSNRDVKLIIEDPVEGCTDTVVVNVVEPPGLLVQVNNKVDVTCNDGSDGIVNLEVAQGTAPYTFSWTGSNSTTQSANDLAFGTTTVTITDDNGCEITKSIDVGQPDPLTIVDMTKDTVICVGDDVRLFAVGAGGSSPKIYTWAADNQTVAVGNDVVVTPGSGITEYCLTLSEQCGSPVAVSCVIVEYPEAVNPTLVPDKTGECFPIEVTFTNSTNTNEVIDYTIWTYSDGDIDTTAGENSAVHEFGLGIYDVDMEMVSNRGCRYFSSYNQLIEGYPYPEANFYVSPNPVSVYEANVGGFIQSGSDVVSNQWFAAGAEPSYSAVSNPRFKYPNEIENYPLILVVENAYGCTDTLQKLVRVENVVTIFSPNSFTPDGDGLNDTWKANILGIDMQNFKLQIFNRWGEMVFESLDPDGEWDGTYGGKLVKDGAYMWIIRAFDYDNDNKHEFNGTVNVIR